MEAGSVEWLNQDEETPTCDLRCVPIRRQDTRHIEVNSVAPVQQSSRNRAQRARLLDPDDDYMLLMVGFFENLLPCDGRPPAAPLIRVLRCSPWPPTKCGTPPRW